MNAVQLSKCTAAHEWDTFKAIEICSKQPVRNHNHHNTSFVIVMHVSIASIIYIFFAIVISAQGILKAIPILVVVKQIFAR